MPASNRGYPASDVVTRYCNVVGFVSFAFMPLCYLLLFYSGGIACACGFMYCMTKPSGALGAGGLVHLGQLHEFRF